MKDNSGKIMLALLAGASAGVIAGLLMAPDSGEMTRGNLKKTASKIGKDLEKKLQASMEKMEGLNAGALMGMVTGKGGETGGTTGNGGNKGGTTGGGSKSGTTGGSSSSGGSTSGGGNMSGGGNA